MTANRNLLDGRPLTNSFAALPRHTFGAEEDNPVIAEIDLCLAAVEAAKGGER